MTQSLSFRYDTGRDWADYQRRRPRETQERTSRRPAERILAEETGAGAERRPRRAEERRLADETGAGAEPEEETVERRRTRDAGVVGRCRRDLRAGNADTESDSHIRGTGKGGAAAPPRISVSTAQEVRDLHTGGPVPVNAERPRPESRSSADPKTE